MSDTTNIPNRVFVREENIPQAPPPLSTSGIIGWLRQNLFSSPLNAVLNHFEFLSPIYGFATVDRLGVSDVGLDRR